MKIKKPFTALLSLILILSAAPGVSQDKILLPVEPVPEPAETNAGELVDCYFKVADIIEKKRQEDPYRAFKATTRERVMRWLLKAAELETDPCHQKYLTVLSGNVRNENWFHCAQPQWSELNENRYEIIFPRDNRIFPKLWAVSGIVSLPSSIYSMADNHFFNTLVYANRPGETTKYSEYTDIFSKMNTHLPKKLSPSTAFTPYSPSIKIADLIYTQHPGTSSVVYSPRMFKVSGEAAVERQDFKIVIFKNVADAYFEAVLRPIAGRILGFYWLYEPDTDAYLSNLVMRRISHHLGPVFLIRLKYEDQFYNYGKSSSGKGSFQQERQKKRVYQTLKPQKREKELKTIPRVMKQYFPAVEAVKSQAIALHNTTVLIENGLIPEDRDVAIYATHVLSLLDVLRRVDFGKSRQLGSSGLPNFLKKKNGKEIVAALIVFNHFITKEAITYNITSKRIGIDRFKFRKAAEELTEEVLRLYDTASDRLAESFLLKKSRIPVQLDAIIDRIKDIPQTVEYRLER